MRAHWKYFGSSIIVTVIGMFAAYGVGYYYGNGSHAYALQMVFFAAILSVLETSLSFDNAVVNAKVLKQMTPVWQHRFLTWGMLIAVFGMRIVFPLLIVGIVAQLAPWDALVLAAGKPEEYARIMLSAHNVIAGFGGAFLLMVGLKYFFDQEKDVHWIRVIERPMKTLGRMHSVELALAMLLIYFISTNLSLEESHSFMIASVFGLITFVAVDGIGAFLGEPQAGVTDIHKASAGMFLYLEVLDASFSFDGVVGAFAITNNLFIIAIGLGVGAMFVRSMTIMLVDKGTLSEFRYLEHGAFYAILALAGIMFLNTTMHIPELITGIIGAAFIGFSLVSSVRYNRKHRHDDVLAHDRHLHSRQ